jgi:toxin HigB-1
LPQDFLRKIARILTVLDAVTKEEDIWQLGSGIHRLSGDLSDYWSIKVSGNYRIIFRFKDGDVFDVDYLDYH